jgi:membrane associated rhomboid family serine protease
VEVPDQQPPPSPPPLALRVGLDLVTRYRLRLTDPRDGRLGPLATDYVLGAAAWTGRRAAYVGFYEPPPDPADAARDLERRIQEAAAWGQQRLQVQGAERCDILLIALGPVPRPAAVAALAPSVHVGAVAIDSADDVAVLATPPPGLPSPGELRSHARAVRAGQPVPTLAAVDLAERQTVAGGYTQPARRAISSTTPVTFSLIALFVVCWIAESAGLDHVRSLNPGVPRVVVDTAGLLAMGGLPDSGPLSHDWWRYVSSAFLHDTSIYHVASNSFAMFFIGRLVEQLYGRLVLVGAFLVSAVGAGLFWVGLTAAGVSSANPVSPGIGASGGIAGLAGLLLMLGRVQGRDVPAGLSRGIRQFVILIAVINLVIGLSVAGVNNYAHVGGFLTGVLLGLALPPLRAVGGRDLRVVEQLLLLAVVVGSAAALGVGIQHAADFVNQGQIGTVDLSSLVAHRPL